MKSKSQRMIWLVPRFQLEEEAKGSYQEELFGISLPQLPEDQWGHPPQTLPHKISHSLENKYTLIITWT